MRQFALYTVMALFLSLGFQSQAMSQDVTNRVQQKRVVAPIPKNNRPNLGVQGYATQAGYHITYVVPGSVAAKLGLERGDIIRRVNKSWSRSTQSLIRALDRAAGPQYRGSLDITVENIRWKTGRSNQKYVRVQGNLYGW